MNKSGVVGWRKKDKPCIIVCGLQELKLEWWHVQISIFGAGGLGRILNKVLEKEYFGKHSLWYDWINVENSIKHHGNDSYRVGIKPNFMDASPITRPENFKTNCRRHFKVHLKWEISAI